MRRRAGLRLVPVLAVAWSASALAIFLGDAATTYAVVLWVCALGTAVLVSMGTWPRGVPLSLIVLVLASAAGATCASHVALAAPGRTELASLSVDGGRALSIVATVVGKIERRGDGMLAFDAVARRIAVGSESSTVDIPVVVRAPLSSVDGDRQALDVGATVRALGSARQSDAGDRAVLEVTASRGLDVIAPPGGVFAVTGELRRTLLRSASTLPGGGAALVPGLAVGDTTLVDDRLDASMKSSSLSHLTAVSGANCAIVVGIAFGAAAMLGARRWLRVVAGLIALAGFVLLVTPEPSVVRAAAMAVVAMLGVLWGRQGVGIAVLSVAATIMLMVDPWLAGSLGFALSVAATASLLLAAKPIARGLTRWLPRGLALALAVPLAAQLACGPLLVLITPTVPLYGVIANLLAAPAAPLATVIGLAACVAGAIPWMQDGLVALAWLPSSWIAGTATTFASLPGGALSWLEGWWGAVALAVVGAAAGIVIGVGPSARRTVSLIHSGSAVLLAIVVGGSAATALLASTLGPWTLPRDWTVAACDVGQGDAVMLRSAGAVALVDTGPDPAALGECLARTGVQRIDLLVLTHFDADHVGGVSSVIGRVGKVLFGPAPPEAEEILSRLEGAGAQLVNADSTVNGTLGGAHWQVLWPRSNSHSFAVGNDASVVLDVAGGGIPPMLMLGDLSESPQRAVLDQPMLRAEYAVVKVAHHGSADQSRELYEHIDADVALITVGADNRYDHPRDEIIAILDSGGSRIARTDREGLIALSTHGGKVSIWRERGG